ncbi:DHS-like NAD/FAD-binding domain [Phytophthora cactorum]|nr:DHS-like NAD/FAD-binding domain [Phytophthora cactorum]
MSSAYSKTVGGKLQLKGGLSLKPPKKHKHKKKSKGSSKKRERDAATLDSASKPFELVKVRGSGRLLSSGTTLMGQVGSKFLQELHVGDAIVIQHPTSLVEETRIVRMVLSDVSASVSSAFSSDLVSSTPFYYIKAPPEDGAQKEEEQEKQKKRKMDEKTAFGTYAGGTEKGDSIRTESRRAGPMEDTRLSKRMLMWREVGRSCWISGRRRKEIGIAFLTEMQSQAVKKAVSNSSAHDATRLRKFLEAGRGKTMVLTGAGISTDSGIPDYRGPNGVYNRNKDFRPIQFQEFIGAHTYRQRYWARSFLGWPKILNTQPNGSHHALSELQQAGAVSSILTQNVDRLHTKSGSHSVIEMHGSLHEVECQGCGQVTSRQSYQETLAELNPKVVKWSTEHPDKETGDVASSDKVNPDGDVDISWNYDDFVYPACSNCGGIMKPRVVFFGENMPAATRTNALERVSDANALLVVGSSLKVFSAMRLINHAHARKIPIAIVNLGPTRADELCSLRIDKSCTSVLTEVADLY